ncbi:MAG TPA: NERD domain-containing protein [Mycobacteriales bacterium]|nr:NERD domain-containing protein [Mycobacteriales bacterium]
MAARSLPPELEQRDGYRGEWDVWDRLRRDLPDGAVLLCGVKVPHGPSGRQIDFLVLWPGVGIGVVEVKGGTVSCDGDGRWTSHRAGRSRAVENPMHQVETVRHELHRFLRDSGYAAASARTQHLVVLPHSRLPKDFDPTSCPRRQVVDVDQLPSLVPVLEDLVATGSGFAPLDAAAVDPLVRLFEQQLQPDPLADLREHEERAAQLAVQQVDVLDLLSRQRSFTVIGGAGTGKTGLALEQARRLAGDGKRVALLCYSRGLARYLQLQAQQWSRPPACVGTFHRLALDHGAPEGEGDDYFERTVPLALREAATGSDDRFDAVVVDEAQDFGELWWPALTAWLAAPDEGGVFAFLDEGQRLFERQSTAPVDGQPYPLRRNYRNTRRIAQTFGSLALEQGKYEGREGTHVRYVPCATADAVSRADDVVDALLDVWEPHQVALLTTKHRHPEHVDRVQREGDDAYWEEFFTGEDVFYGTVSGFKGLERTCVVLAVNGFSAQARAREMLYVGLSRARSQLVVVGDLDEIAPAGVRDGVRTRLLGAERWDPPALA